MKVISKANDMLEQSVSLYRIINGTNGKYSLIDQQGLVVSEDIDGEELIEYVEQLIGDEQSCQ